MCDHITQRVNCTFLRIWLQLTTRPAEKIWEKMQVVCLGCVLWLQQGCEFLSFLGCVQTTCLKNMNRKNGRIACPGCVLWLQQGCEFLSFLGCVQTTPPVKNLNRIFKKIMLLKLATASALVTTFTVTTTHTLGYLFCVF